jgi:hypothetical protein
LILCYLFSIFLFFINIINIIELPQSWLRKKTKLISSGEKERDNNNNNNNHSPTHILPPLNLQERQRNDTRVALSPRHDNKIVSSSTSDRGGNSDRSINNSDRSIYSSDRSINSSDRSINSSDRSERNNNEPLTKQHSFSHHGHNTLSSILSSPRLRTNVPNNSTTPRKDDRIERGERSERGERIDSKGQNSPGNNINKISPRHTVSLASLLGVY